MGSEAECGCGPIGVGLGSGTEGFASGDLASWREGQPGGEVLLGGPAGHVQADLANELEGGLGINAFDGGEIDPGDAAVAWGGGGVARLVVLGAVTAQAGRLVRPPLR